MTGTLPVAPVLGAGARVGALRRTATDAQRDFTTLLDVLARPGKIGRLQVPAGVPAAALAACGLVDVEVELRVLTGDDTEGQDWGEAVHAATSAPRSELEFARTVLALRPVTADEVAQLPRGDALNPERGARLFATVDELTPGDGPLTLRLTGPGVPGERLLGVRGLPAAVFEALATANSGFPLGVDTFLVAGDGAVAGLPRSTRLSIVRVGTAGD